MTFYVYTGQFTDKIHFIDKALHTYEVHEQKYSFKKKKEILLTGHLIDGKKDIGLTRYFIVIFIEFSLKRHDIRVENLIDRP